MTTLNQTTYSCIPPAAFHQQHSTSSIPPAAFHQQQSDAQLFEKAHHQTVAMVYHCKLEGIYTDQDAHFK